MYRWHIVHTRLRWERKVTEFLEQKGIQVFFPVKKVRRRWSDRFKTVEEPLFKSYVFVKITEDERTNVRITDGVLNFVHHKGKTTTVREKEIKAIRKFIQRANQPLNSAVTDPESGRRKLAIPGMYVQLDTQAPTLKTRVCASQ